MAQKQVSSRAHRNPLHRAWRLIRGRARTLVAVLVMAATWLLVSPALGEDLGRAGRALVAWNVGAALWLAMATMMMARSDPERMRRRAAAQDDGAAIMLLVSCVAAVACLLAIASVLVEAPHFSDAARSWHIGLGVATLFSAWLFMHMTFTLHYAHAWYERGGDGLRFPEHTQAPDYFDFVYFAFTIGVACQTADVSVTSRRMRRLVIAHSVLSFFFNTAVLALGVNVAASVVGS